MTTTTKPTDAKQRAIRTLEALRKLGPGLTWPTNYQPHLCTAKKGKNDPPAPHHGVMFRRDRQDCVVEAHNGIACVRIRLRGEAEYCPKQAIVPAKAMKLLAQAEDDTAQLWFHGLKVTIVVDREIHEFECIAPNLPFPQAGLNEESASRSVSNLIVDAEQLRRIQRALDCQGLLVLPAKGCKNLVLWPDGEVDADRCALMAPWTYREDEDS